MDDLLALLESSFIHFAICSIVSHLYLLSLHFTWEKGWGANKLDITPVYQRAIKFFFNLRGASPYYLLKAQWMRGVARETKWIPGIVCTVLYVKKVLTPVGCL